MLHFIATYSGHLGANLNYFPGQAYLDFAIEKIEIEYAKPARHIKIP